MSSRNMTIDEILQIPPFSLCKADKEELLSKRLLSLTGHHIDNCPQYAAMMRGIGFDPAKSDNYHDIPFLPVSLFKELELKSIPDNEIFKITTSSGTTGQAVSKIYLDKAGAGAQQKVLAKIVPDFIGAGRMPMLIIDNPSVLKNRAMFSARGAGILGFSIFGADKAYALNDYMEPDIPAIEEFFEKHRDRKILLFGFTFMIWQHFYKQLQRQNKRINTQGGVLIHGGGWKKLTSEAVTKDEFRQSLIDSCSLSGVHDYYGMVEQTGTIYMECEYGHLHASVFSDIIIRNHEDFSQCSAGEKGIVQVVSVLPESYPGHSLLTEDEGIIIGEDDCRCGRMGKYFAINGRLKMAEIRGCSDTFTV